MKKSFTAEIGGYYFLMDESDYRYLERYLEQVKLNIDGTTEEKREIMDDIENRIGELLSAKIKSSNDKKITRKLIDEVTAIIGKPEVFNENTGESTSSGKKKLYRNTRKKIVGGVAAGMADYFDTRVIIFRLLWLMVVLFTGVGIIIYILMWILIPAPRGDSPEGDSGDMSFRDIQKRLEEEFQKVSETGEMNAFVRLVRDIAGSFEEFFHNVFQSKSKQKPAKPSNEPE